jgi:hypothetical protein
MLSPTGVGWGGENFQRFIFLVRLGGFCLNELMPVAAKLLARKRAEPRVSRRYLLECVDVCRQREAASPNSAVDMPLEDFLRSQAKTPKGK